MKRPETSTHTSDPNLVGATGKSSWVQGLNCVYRDASTTQYRVAILTDNGWKSFGHFHNRDNAAYVANVAILVEDCEDRYELNEIGTKDREELIRWRKAGNNAELEQEARSKHRDLLVRLAEIRAQTRRLEEEEFEKAQAEKRRLQERIAARQEETEAKKREREAKQQEREARVAAILASAPKSALLEMLTRDIGGEQHRRIHAELARREESKRSGT